MYGYGYSLYNQVPFGRGGIDPAAAAYFTATGITGATQQTAIDNLVKGLKQDGLWSKMKAVYPFVTDNRNLLSYTEDFGNAYWNLGTPAIKTPNYATAPDGTMTACRVYNGGYIQSQGISKQIGTYVFSLYVKMTSGTSGTIRLFVDGGATRTIVNVTNTWTRVEVNQTFALTDTSTIGFFVDSDVLIWHPQVELGSTATTYQPIATTQQAFISSQFKYNLVNPVDSDAAFRLVFNGGWTHSANGATPNGTNGYADTRLNWDSNTSLNDVSFGCYWRNDIQATFSGGYYGVVGGGAYVLMRDRVSCDFYVNDNGTGTIATLSKGLHLANRKNSTQQTLYVNGSGTAQSRASLSKPNLNFYFGGSNGFTSYTNNQMALALISDGLTDTEAANLYTRVQAFQTALSRQV